MGGFPSTPILSRMANRPRWVAKKTSSDNLVRLHTADGDGDGDYDDDAADRMRMRMRMRMRIR